MLRAPQRFLLTVSVAAALAAASPTAQADTETAEVARAVALHGVEGPGAAEINAALVAAFERHGYAVERGKAANGAESAGYIAVVTGKVVKRKRKLTATIQLRSAPGGEPLASARFRGNNPKLLAREVRRDAWDKFGPTLETRVQSMTETVTPQREPVTEPEPEPEPEPTPAPVADKPAKKTTEPVTHGKDTGEQVYVQADGTKFTRLSTKAARRSGPIVIDGKDKDKAWKAVPETLVDWQQRPAEGYGKDTLTYFRVLYDDDALYVFVRAADPPPNKIGAILNRGDDFGISIGSDWIAILVDPTLNRRTGYGFQVNPAGVKIDYRMLDDAYLFDMSYNPVWEVKSRINDDGWTTEVRIPFSQMRVQSGRQQDWGFQIYRRYMRNVSHFYWSPQPYAAGRGAGLWGTLAVNDEVTPGRSLQIAPYTAAGVELKTVAEADTINDEVRPLGKLGVDLQIALTDGLTFTSAVNPDFGQVEADPSEVNLTANETFFSERRPFFTKDDELFLMPIGRVASERLYYTRRVGAPPRLTQAGAAQFVDEEQASTIYNASKITGQLPGGFTLGLLGTITAEEKSRGQLMNGDINTITIDPMTTYSVGQLGKTFRGGDSDLRLSGTNVHRFLDGTDIETLTTNAYSGGLQYTHRFGEKKWNLQLQALGSHVEGSTTAIDIIQRASPRYFQRPDAEHLDYDPSRTTLTGYAGKLSLARTGLAWAGSVGVDARAPEFETNDMGFLLDSDLINTWADLAFVNFSKGLAKQIDIAGSVNSFADFSGEILRHQFAVKNLLGFRNETSINTKMSYLYNRLDTRLLRGGPAIAGSDEMAAGIWYNTDAKRSFVLRPQFDYAFRPDSASRRFTAQCFVKWNPATNIELSVTPTFTSNIDHAQFVPPPQLDADMNRHYILGRIYQRTLFATTRMSYTFTPQIAFDVYAQPFLSVGKFSEFVEPDDLRARDFDARFRPLAVSNEMGMIGADFDGDGAVDSTFRSPDFSITRLNTNVVFRWEYLPGSFMYAIFSSAARGFAPDGTLSKDDYETVWTAEGEKVVLIKLSYWWDR